MVMYSIYFDEQVSRDDEGDGTRRVELSGSDDAIAEAKELINQILESDDRGGSRQSYGMFMLVLFNPYLSKPRFSNSSLWGSQSFSLPDLSLFFF